jgi:hypothetical protein
MIEFIGRCVYPELLAFSDIQTFEYMKHVDAMNKVSSNWALSEDFQILYSYNGFLTEC